MAFVAAMVTGLIHGQVRDVTGDWRVGAGAVFRLAHSAIPPLAMARNGLGHIYSSSLPAMTISSGASDRPAAQGFLQEQASPGKFEGELAFAGGCWSHLSLQLSDDGSTLSGTARINTRISSRQCTRSLAREFRKGEPFPYVLIRLR